MEDREIHIKDLLLQICLKWPVILVCMILGAIVFDGLSIVKSYKSAKAELAASTNKEVDIESYQKGLNIYQRKATERAFVAYEQADKNFQEIRSYLENSVRMQTDMRKIPTTYLYYEVKNCSNFYGFTEYINQNFINTAWFNKVIDTLDLPYEANELAGSVVITRVEKEGTVYMDLIPLEDDKKIRPSYCYVRAMGKDEETTGKIVDLFNQELESRKDELEKAFPGVKVRLLSKRYTEVADFTMSTEKQMYLDRLNTAQNTANNFLTNMTDAQKAYFYALMTQKQIEEEAANPEAEASEETSPQTISVSYVSKKFILVGLVAGAFLACLYYFLIYVFSNNIHLADELPGFFKVTLLGEMEDDSKKNYKGLNGLFYHIFRGSRPEFSQEERLEMICAGIKIAARKGEMKKIHITGAATSPCAIAFHDKLKESLADSGLEITHGRSIVYDPVSLENMTSSDGIVFVEQIDHSPCADITKEVNVSEKYKVPVIGAVVLG